MNPYDPLTVAGAGMPRPAPLGPADQLGRILISESTAGSTAFNAQFQRTAGEMHLPKCASRGVQAVARCSDAEQHTSDPPLKRQQVGFPLVQAKRRRVAASFEQVANAAQNTPLSDRGFFETISIVQPTAPLYVVRFLNTSRSGLPISFSPLRVNALAESRGFVSCNVRRGAQFVSTAGVFSCWSSIDSQVVMVAYDDAALVCEWFEQWDLTAEQRNKLQKIKNGNGCDFCGADGPRLCDTCSADNFAGAKLGPRESRRRDKDAQAGETVTNLTCQCGTSFPLTKAMCTKMSNHKSKGVYYGFDKCEQCRAADHKFEEIVAEAPGAPLCDAVKVVAAQAAPAPVARAAFVPLSSPKGGTVPASGPLRAEAGDTPTHGKKQEEPPPPTYEEEFQRLLLMTRNHTRADGLKGDVWILAGNLKPGDIILAREFTEPYARASEDTILRMMGHDCYRRVGSKLKNVSIDGAVFPSNDWLFDPVPVAWVGARQLRARQVGFKDVEGIAMGLFEISATREDMTPVRHRYSEFTYKRRHYAAFRGSVNSEVIIDGRRLFVPSQTLGETLRYFSGEATARVSASYIMGELKRNSKLSAEQIDYIVRYACAHHDSRAVAFAEAISGDRLTTARVAEEMTQIRYSWWLPTCMARFRCDFDNSKLRFWVYLMVLALLAYSMFTQYESLVTVYRVAKMASALNFTGLVFNSSGLYPPPGSLVTRFILHRRFRKVGRKHIVFKEFVASCEHGEVPGLNCSHIVLSEEEAYLYANAVGPSPDYRCFFPESFGEITGNCSAAKALDGVIQNWYSRGRAGLANPFRDTWSYWDDYRKELETATPVMVVVFWWLNQILWGELHSLYLAPLWEERVKRIKVFGIAGLLTYAIIAIEVTLHSADSIRTVREFYYGDWFYPFVAWHLFMKYWPTAYMHIVASRMPVEGGIIYHMFWNHLALGVPNILAFYGAAWKMGPVMLCTLLRVCYIYSSMWYNGVGGRWEPGAVTGGFGLYLGAVGISMAVKAYHRGHSDRFPLVDGMGTHSKFRELVEDPDFETVFPLKDSANFKVRGAGRVGRNRLTQLMPEFVPVASFESNQSNILHSMAGRVLKKTPELSRSTDRLASKLDRMSRKMGYVEPDEPDEWVRKFPAGKRERYLKAFVRLSVFGLACFGRVLLGAHNKWDKRSCFIKHEVNLQQPEVIVELNGSQFHTACGDPRTIQASTDEVQAVLGRYFTAYGRRAAEVFDGSAGSEIDGWRIVAAFGRTKTEVSKITRQLLMEGRSAVVCCGDDAKVVYKGRLHAIDAKRWDAHVGRGLLKLKYRHLTLLGMPDRISQILQDMIARRGSYKRSGVSFEVDGDVASGDPDTLYWNTMLGVASIIDCFEGAADFDDFNRRAMEYGLEYKLAATGTVSDPGVFVDFCSCVWTPVLGGLSLVPKLGRALMKVSATATFGNPAKLLAAKLLGLIHDLAAFPEVVRALARLLPDLPAGKASSESYVAVGKVEPAPLAEREQFFRERYAVEYTELVDEVEEWVDRSRRGDMAAGDLVRMRSLVEVDYGDKPMVSRCGGVMRSAVLLACLVGVACGPTQGQICRRVGGLDLSPEPTLSYQRYLQTMPNKGKKNNNAAKAVATLQLGQSKQPRGRDTPRRKTAPTPSASTVSGDGLYRLLGPLAKAAVRAALPSAMGQAARLLRPNASNIRGSGDYVTNDIVHSANSMPSMKGNAGVPLTKFTHSEYVTDLLVPAVPANFNVTRYNINAADAQTFPWLSRLASLYTKYKFTKLLFEFRSNTSNYSSAGALGTVIMAPQYNVDSQLFTTKQLMEATTHAVSSAPSNSVLMGFECAKVDNINQWYVVLNDSNLVRNNFSDMGSVAIATSGLPGTAGTSLGELWVHYTCELIEPFISVTDAVSTGALAMVTGFTQTAGNAATFSTGSFGFQNSAMTAQTAAYFSSTPGAYQVGTKTTNSVLPTGTNWFVSCAGDAGAQFGLRLAGVYEITLKMRFSASPTTSTGAPYDLSANTGTLISVIGNNSSTTEITYNTPAIIISYRWVVTVGALTGLTTTPGPGFTGLGAVNVTNACLTVVKIA